MPNISAGSSATFTIPTGQVARLSGSGVAVLNSPSSSPITLNNSSVIGPYESARTVTVSANSGGISYYVATPSNPAAAPVTLQRNQLGEAISLAFEGQSYNTAVYSVIASGDTTGVTDSANIQAAIAMVAASSTARGAVELVGAFYLRAVNSFGAAYIAITLASNVDIIGRNNAVLRLAASTQPNGWGGFVLYGNAVSNIRIRGLELDGNRSSFTSPAFANAQDGVAGSGLRLINSQDVSMEDCSSHSNIYHGCLAVDGCQRVSISFNRLYDNGYRAAHFNAVDAAPMFDCKMNFNVVYGNGAAADNTDNSGLFPALGACSRIECIGNEIRDEVSGAGIDLTGTGGGTAASSEIIVTNNTVIRAKYGVRVSNNMIDSIVDGNTFSFCTVSGAYLGASKNISFCGNVIRRSTSAAVAAASGGVGITIGTAANDILTGCRINGNTVDDCDGNVSTRTAIYVNTGSHVGCSISGNTIINNGVTAGTTCGGIAFGDPATNRSKSMQVNNNVITGNRGHAIVVYDADNISVRGNQTMDNYEASGPRGTAIWIRGTCDGANVKDNICLNDNIVNNQTQVQFDATVTNFRCIENTAESTAANKFLATTGATGAAYGNTGTASWAAGVLTGSAAL